MKTSVAPVIPEIFIREYLDSKPLYYKGYKRVNADPERIEEIKGVGGLHSILVTGMLDKLITNEIRKKFWLCPGRPGLQIASKNILCVDFAVVSKEKLPLHAISNDFLRIPPEFTVEIDISVVCKGISRRSYIDRKIQHLLQFGTKRIVWIFLEERQVLIAEHAKENQWLQFTDDFSLMGKAMFNICRFAQSENLTHLRCE